MKDGIITDEYSFSKYKKSLIEIQRDERTEENYYPLIESLLKSIYLNDAKVIKVANNRCSKIHDRKVYAKEGGLSDIIIVPNIYTYEKVVKQYANVEIKMPNIDIEDGKIMRYNKIKLRKMLQLEKQFESTTNIIFTDSITWYFLTKDKNQSKMSILELCLIERCDKGWVWKIDREQNELKIQSKTWRELKREVEKFLEIAKAKY
jgi:hypothetical protein